MPRSIGKAADDTLRRGLETAYRHHVDRAMRARDDGRFAAIVALLEVIRFLNTAVLPQDPQLLAPLLALRDALLVLHGGGRLPAMLKPLKVSAKGQRRTVTRAVSKATSPT